MHSHWLDTNGGIKPDFYITKQLIIYFYINRWNAVESVLNQAVTMPSHCDWSLCPLTVSSSICFFGKAKNSAMLYKEDKTETNNKNSPQNYYYYQLLWIGIWQKFVPKFNWQTWQTYTLLWMHVTKYFEVSDAGNRVRSRLLDYEPWS